MKGDRCLQDLSLLQVSKTATRPSRTDASAWTNWKSAATTSTGSTDFDLVQELGLKVLRYGPPLHRTWLGPKRYDWEFADLDLQRPAPAQHRPIVDLCHFGVPDWIGNFQNPDFPELFADYAARSRERYPWVQLYTPINEMSICALFSPCTAGGTSR
jgi:beta-glucosidase/6-phospho-beta-glucosidase/beta-galactosidase